MARLTVSLSLTAYSSSGLDPGHRTCIRVSRRPSGPFPSRGCSGCPRGPRPRCSQAQQEAESRWTRHAHGLGEFGDGGACAVQAGSPRSTVALIDVDLSVEVHRLHRGVIAVCCCLHVHVWFHCHVKPRFSFASAKARAPIEMSPHHPMPREAKRGIQEYWRPPLDRATALPRHRRRAVMDRRRRPARQVSYTHGHG